MRKVAECAYHRGGLVAVEFLQQPVEFRGSLAIVLPAETHRGLADGLDGFERRLPFLLTQYVAQQSAQKPDVLA